LIGILFLRLVISEKATRETMNKSAQAALRQSARLRELTKIDGDAE
jgi:hypothetical protein